jgi:hypothetical protein
LEINNIEPSFEEYLEVVEVLGINNNIFQETDEEVKENSELLKRTNGDSTKYENLWSL